MGTLIKEFEEGTGEKQREKREEKERQSTERDATNEEDREGK